MEIRQLGVSEYKGMTLNVTYETERFYDVAVRENGFELLLSQFDEPQIKSFSDKLFSQWLEAPVAFGAFEGESSQVLLREALKHGTTFFESATFG